ncbi:hypothetical protein HCG51_28490 [Tolypothrix sp. PCC 7910]|nr:hypothetical protein [Tolypothrix sp. PCC 7910]QIR35288.1 hypothetical protein HCG51_28490 [Tolypothrix sp. PCC 7910]
MTSDASTKTSVQPIPLIVNDDGSQDGVTALAFMLANPKYSICQSPFFN